MQEIVSFIMEAGITIAAIVGMAYAIIMLFKAYKEVRDKSDERIEQMMEKITDLTGAVNNNTLTVTKLVEKMDYIVDHEKAS